MPPAKSRTLNKTQQGYAVDGAGVIKPALAAFVASHPSFRAVAGRMELESIAHEAVVMAAFTYNPLQSKVTTYFSRAIINAVRKSCVAQRRRDHRFCDSQQALDNAASGSYGLRGARAMRALQTLPPEHRILIEDRLFDNVTLEQLAAEQRCDWRTVQRKLTESLVMLRQAEAGLPK